MLKKILKDYSFTRALIGIYKVYFSFRKSKLGFCGKNVYIGPGTEVGNPKNVYLYDNASLQRAIISATNAKFIMKMNSVAAAGLMVRTGNHMMEVGKFFKDLDDQYKINTGRLSDYDKDIIVEEDVWIGCNVTLLYGAHIGRGAI